MPVSKSLKAAQDNYKKRNKQKGMVRVNVWVPIEDAEELRLIASEMRTEMKQAAAATP